MDVTVTVPSTTYFNYVVHDVESVEEAIELVKTTKGNDPSIDEGENWDGDMEWNNAAESAVV